MSFSFFFYASLAPKEDSYKYESRTVFTLYRYKMSRLECVFRSVMKTPINTLRNDSFRINFTLVSCGNRYELVLERNSFGYHVKGPKKFLFPEHYSPV